MTKPTKQKAALPARDTLNGLFFHSTTSETKEGKSVETVLWQGLILGSPFPGYYLVQLFEWLMGGPSCLRLVRIEEMTSWRLYPTGDEMREAWERLRPKHA